MARAGNGEQKICTDGSSLLQVEIWIVGIQSTFQPSSYHHGPPRKRIGFRLREDQSALRVGEATQGYGKYNTESLSKEAWPYHTATPPEKAEPN